MDRIRELLARLAELTADELTELRGLITEQANELAGAPRTAESVAALGELATGLDAVDAEETTRAEAQAALDAEADAALARINPPADAEPADGEVVAEAEQVAADAAAAADAESVAAAATPAPRRPSLAAAQARRTPAAASPSPTETERPRGAAITAAADVPGVQAGAEFGNIMELAEAFEKRRAQVGRAKGGDDEKVVVASARYDFPEDRRLTDNPTTNTRLIRAAIDNPENQALVAAGGLCAPLENIYDVEVVGVTDRPVQASLPGFNATRGGVSLRPSPVFQDFNGATGIWTMANDVSPSSPTTKPILEVLCQAFENFTVDAVTMRLRFHNITSRFDPEGTAANIQAAMVAHARLAENELLSKMFALAKTLTHPAAVSATRDLLVMVDKTIAYYKFRHRVGDQTVLHAWLPRWVKDMIRADITRGPAYTEDNLAKADAEIEEWFRRRNVNVTWHLDGRTASADLDPGVGTLTVGIQGYADVANLGAVPGFPDTVEVLLATEGDYLYLDGGELDLGVVRDSTLVGVNEYQTFTETFEGIASRGLESIRVIATVQPSGTSSGPKDLSALVD